MSMSSHSHPFTMTRLARSILFAGILAAMSNPLWAQTSVNDYGVHHRGSVIGDDVLYSIGGGRAVSMGPVGQMQHLGVGIGWNSNLICGDMSITTTLQNQLNGITNGFQTIMSQVIQNATAAVASLPALIIQRADPGLYNLLTNGILQARLDFDRSKLTCRAIANRMADAAGGQLGWDQLAEGMALKQAVASTDAVSAIEQAETSRGNDGVPWVGGDNAGGAGVWWSSSPYGGNAWLRNLNGYFPDILRHSYFPRTGFSVRCLRDAD